MPATAPAFRVPVGSWALQLHDVDVDAVARLDVDWVVVDSGDGPGAQSSFQPGDVRRMQARSGGAAPPGRKRVLAYLSVGEAETYRPYWRPEWERVAARPAWLEGENADWADNYRVRFWETGWQKILFGTPQALLDRILAAGFDGVYLDIVDAYETYQASRPTAREEMISLVVALAAHARRQRPDFLVVAQNGETLLESESYRGVLSAVAKEDLHYGAVTDGRPNDATAIQRSLTLLELAQRDGVGVLLVEYLDAADKIARVSGEAARLGHTVFIAPSEGEGREPLGRQTKLPAV